MSKRATTNFDPLRRQLLATMACSAVALSLALPSRARAESVSIDVWKSPTCGCCKDWVAHLEANGFDVTVHDIGNYEARQRLRLPIRFGSCHTGEVQGYAIEGHVPASDIHRLLEEKPDAVGLSVPAMPRGSPGMDGPAYGGIKDPYDVLLIGTDGKPSVFQSYR